MVAANQDESDDLPRLKALCISPNIAPPPDRTHHTALLFYSRRPVFSACCYLTSRSEPPCLRAPTQVIYMQIRFLRLLSGIPTSLMPPRRTRSHRTPTDPSSSSPPTPSHSGFVPAEAHTIRVPPAAPLQAYPDYIHSEAARFGWISATRSLESLLTVIPSILPLALIGPLIQVAYIMSGMIEAVKTMRDGRDECMHLTFRVLTFLHSLADELRGGNVRILDGSPLALRLYALKRWCFPYIIFVYPLGFNEVTLLLVLAN